MRLSRTRPPGGRTRDSFVLTLDDGRALTVARVRDARARRLRLTVDARGARLTLPATASLAAGERFAQAHRAWLASQLDALADGIPAPLVPGAATALPLRGDMLPLIWQAGPFASLTPMDDGLCFRLPPRAGAPVIRRALHDFYQAQARADLGRWLPAYLPGLPRAPGRLRLKPMASQWGSLSPAGVVALDLALVLGRPGAFEYVLVHELCHLLQANHSPTFWAEVQARFPAWRDERDYLRAEGARLKAMLHALLAT